MIIDFLARLVFPSRNADVLFLCSIRLKCDPVLVPGCIFPWYLWEALASEMFWMPTELLSCIRRRAILLVFYARKVEFPRRELHLYLRLLLLTYEVLSQRAIVPINLFPEPWLQYLRFVTKVWLNRRSIYQTDPEPGPVNKLFAPFLWKFPTIFGISKFNYFFWICSFKFILSDNV